MHPPRVVLVSPGDPGALLSRPALVQALAPHADLLILRWRRSSAREIVEGVARLAALSPRPALLLRDRFDLALAAGADGVQLPEDSLRPAEVRACWPDATLGISRHDGEGLRGAAASGADFALLSPVHATDSKPGHPGMGLDDFGTACRQATLPVIALGGMDPQVSAAALRAGAKGVAVRSAVFGAADPVAAASELRAAVESALSGTPDHD